MNILAKKLTREEFEAYVSGKNLGNTPPDQIVLHHTWKPTKASWSGIRTINGLKNYYEGKRWSAGPHIFVAEDGIWLFTDMYRRGIHAGSANARWGKSGKIYRGYNGPTGAKLLGYSIGVEVVGNYDERPWSGETKTNTLAVLSTLRKKLDITIDDIDFHREFSNKSCPGNAITRNWLGKNLRNFENSRNSEGNNDNNPTHEPVIESNYRFRFSEETAMRAKKLGLLQQINSETREIIAIGLVRLYDKIKKENP